MTDDPCAECGGRCCSFRTMTISYQDLEYGERYDSHMLEDEMINQLAMADGSVPDMDWYVLEFKHDDGKRYRGIGFECNHLTEDGRCGVYENRPGMCRDFECPVLDDDMPLDQFVQEYGRNGLPDSATRDVTDRVNEIIDRRIGGSA